MTTIWMSWVPEDHYDEQESQVCWKTKYLFSHRLAVYAD